MPETGDQQESDQKPDVPEADPSEMGGAPTKAESPDPPPPETKRPSGKKTPVHAAAAANQPIELPERRKVIELPLNMLPRKGPIPNLSRDFLTTIPPNQNNTEYEVGDLLWAKVVGYPWWPCMVSVDPISNGKYFKTTTVSFKSVNLYYVQFFGIEQTWAYTTPAGVMKFEGLRKYEAMIENKLASSPKSQHPTIKNKYAPPKPLQTRKKWDIAVAEAEEAMKMDRVQRVKEFTFYYTISGAFKSISDLSTPKKQTKSSGKRSGTTSGKKGGKSAQKQQGAPGDVYDFDDDEFSEPTPEKQTPLAWLLLKRSNQGDFSVFCSQHRDEVIAANPGKSPQEIDEMLKHRWNLVSDDLKAKYVRRTFDDGALSPKTSGASSSLTTTPKSEPKAAKPRAKKSLTQAINNTADTPATPASNSKKRKSTANEAMSNGKSAKKQKTSASQPISTKAPRHALAARKKANDSSTIATENDSAVGMDSDEDKGLVIEEKKPDDVSPQSSATKRIRKKTPKAAASENDQKQAGSSKQTPNGKGPTKRSSSKAASRTPKGPSGDDTPDSQPKVKSRVSSSKKKTPKIVKEDTLENGIKEEKPADASSEMEMQAMISESSDEMTESEDTSSSVSETEGEGGDLLKDEICFECHEEGTVIFCTGECKRQFHPKCVKYEGDADSFKCIDCASGIRRCYICNNASSAEAQVEKCMDSNCGRFYHSSCLDPRYPSKLVSVSSSSSSSSSTRDNQSSTPPSDLETTPSLASDAPTSAVQEVVKQEGDKQEIENHEPEKLESEKQQPEKQDEKQEAEKQETEKQENEKKEIEDQECEKQESDKEGQSGVDQISQPQPEPNKEKKLERPKKQPQPPKEKQILCPLHFCLTCYIESKAEKDRGIIRPSKRRLVRCIKCPTAYHLGDSCLAAGTVTLSRSFVICPAHYKNPNKREKHISVQWCFSCGTGGNLVCCENCPAAFHAKCLENEPSGEFYCGGCQNRKPLLYGDIVWVKLGSYRWWPARICHPRSVPENIWRLPHSIGEFPVYFFGSHDYYWSNRGRVFHFVEEDAKAGSKISGGPKSLSKAFKDAMKEAVEEFHKWKTQKESANQTKIYKPPPFVYLKSNKPVGKVTMTEDIKSQTKCECDPESERPCSSDTECHNRAMMLECNPKQCGGGEKCCNQRFRKREYAKVATFRTPDAGWGLKAKEDIKKGQFVIEYVGEIIDEEECQRRLKQLNENSEVNFYFLTIDKDRIIDAGPKGNFARFMNHSCQPNCETQKWMVAGQTRIGLFAVRDIPKGTELTFNYNLDTRGNEKTRCICLAPNCSQYLGVPPTKLLEKRAKETPNGDGSKASGSGKKSISASAKKAAKVLNFAKVHEDDCFRCGERGELLMCDRRGCPKSYHLHCLGIEEVPRGRWECPWHHCFECGKGTIYQCSSCPNAICRDHRKLESGQKMMTTLPDGKFICWEHKQDPTTTTTSEMNGIDDTSKQQDTLPKDEEILSGQEDGGTPKRNPLTELQFEKQPEGELEIPDEPMESGRSADAPLGPDEDSNADASADLDPIDLEPDRSVDKEIDREIEKVEDSNDARTESITVPKDTAADAASEPVQMDSDPDPSPDIKPGREETSSAQADATSAPVVESKPDQSSDMIHE